MRALLVRLDGIGDAAVCAPLIAALREAGHGVGIASTTRNAGLYRPDVLLAEHVLERIPWPAHGSTLESTARAKAEIAAQHYDVALIASEEPEAFDLAAPVLERVGFVTGWSRPLKTLWVRARTTRTMLRRQQPGAQTQHEAQVLYRLGDGLVHGTEAPADVAALAPLFVATPARARTGIMIQAGPKWNASGVADDDLRALVARLQPRNVRVVAAPPDAAAGASLGLPVETFEDLRAWVEAIAGASALISVDTGAAHVAGMLGVPVVDVFPDPHFDAQVRRWRPWASPYVALRASELGNRAALDRIEAFLDGR